MRCFGKCLLLLIAPLMSCMSHASGGGGPKFAEGVNYIDIKPPLIVNYGGAGKMRYIKAEISLRTESMEGAMEITHHLPLIRDKLISILSQQTEEAVATADGKEKLRLFALTEVNKVLHAVEQAPASDVAVEDEEKTKDKKGKKDKKSKDDKAKKDTKDKKDDKKKSDKDKKSKDKKSKSEDEESSQDKKHGEEHAGPASDLFFNNFVVQK
jgi:flagellar protein FliL